LPDLALQRIFLRFGTGFALKCRKFNGEGFMKIKKEGFMRKYYGVLFLSLCATGVFAQENAEVLEPVETQNAQIFTDLPQNESRTDGLQSINAAEVSNPKTAVLPQEERNLPPSGINAVNTEYVLEMERKRRYRGLGGIGFGVYAMDMSPVRELLIQREADERIMSQTDSSLRISAYNLLDKVGKREAMPSFRAIFYIANENKFNLGGLFEAGFASWRNGNVARDTTVTMQFGYTKCGLTMEQILAHDGRNHVALGAALGVGGLGVMVFANRGNGGFWEGDDYDDDDDWSYGDGRSLYAGSIFGFADLNATYILSITQRFHLRLDALCNFMGSKNGYNFSGDGYFTVNSGGALSFVWGKQ
jgi:hypothetical protein